MKKNILAIAIATAVAAPAAMADAKIYGYFNGAMENATEAGTQFDSRNSRVGIKGSEDLGNGLKAIYQFETGIDLMSGKFNNADRNTFLGLNGGFGTVLFGKHDTPLRMIQPSDAFADGKYTGNNRSEFSGATGKEGEQRLSNVLAYVSPDFNGVSFALATSTMQKAHDGYDPTEPATFDKAGVQKKSELGNAISASVAYGKKSDGLYLALGYTGVDYKNDAGTEKVEQELIRVTAQYKADGLTAYAMFNNADKGGAKGDAITLGASYKVGDFTPKAKIAYVDPDVDGAAANKDFTNFAIGTDYNLGKNTRAFVEVAMLDKASPAANGKLLSLDANSKPVYDKKDTTVFSIGMNHKF